MPLRLYNTKTRQKEVFTPIIPGRVGMYACGITVNDFVHIGNLRTYVFEDILRRVLEYQKYRVRHIQNITDVGHLTSDADYGEDKVQTALTRQGLPLTVTSLQKLAATYTTAFQADFSALNILFPKRFTKATEHIPEMIKLIKKIIANGYGYVTDLAVYFEVSRLSDYTRLSRQALNSKQVGARDEVAVDPAKKHPADFALWFKLAGKNKNHIMHWPSPWGEGYPGWHIECSAMSTRYLGERFDIHCGGSDHIPVHHTNERAQNIGAFGAEGVVFWIHGEHLIMADKKMSKSSGSFITLRDLEQQGLEPLAYRYLLLNTHYRQQLHFRFEALRSAVQSLAHWRSLIQNGGRPARRLDGNQYATDFLKAINDDLNLPQALAVAWRLVKDQKLPISQRLRQLFEFDKVFGLGLKEVKPLKIPAKVHGLLLARVAAREKKDWILSDELRRQIEKYGYTIDDTKAGPFVKKLTRLLHENL